MLEYQEKREMPKAEIAELLKLMGWSRTELAARLHLTENTVQRWFMAGMAPDGPASILMRLWLEEAKKQNGRRSKSKVLATA